MTDVTALVGRESELQALLAALAPGSACRITLTTPPGMGKTALVEAFVSAAAALDLSVSWTRPTEVDHRLAFSAEAPFARSGSPVPRRQGAPRTHARPSALRALEQASGGNPLYALELVRRRVGEGSTRTLDRSLPGTSAGDAGRMVDRKVRSVG